MRTLSRQASSERLGEYEQRTGDLLPLNVLAKLTAGLGAIAFIGTLASGGEAKALAVSLGLTVGGLAGDKLTGGLRSYNRVDQEATS